MDLDNIQRKYGLPAPLPVVQNGKFATRFPLNLEHRGDDVFRFGGKYIGEIENIYDLLYKILTNQEIDASLALPYAIKITEDKLYIRDKTNSEWITIFDITKPNFPKEIELYELIYKAITHQVIGEDTSYPGQFKIEENILYVRDKDNLTWTQIGDVTKEFLGATEATQSILDQVNEILIEVQELKTELNRQIATTNETLTTALQAANEAMTSAQSINIRTFANVEEMKTSNTLKAGALAKTQGFYTTGDGGGADYLITNDIGDSEIDEASIITLQNSLYAKLLVRDYVNVKQFGAYGDGEHDDTEAIQKVLDKEKCNAYLPIGIYIISDTLYVNLLNGGLVGTNGKSIIKVQADFNKEKTAIHFYIPNATGDWATRYNHAVHVKDFSVIGNGCNSLSFGACTNDGTQNGWGCTNAIFSNISITNTHKALILGNHVYIILFERIYIEKYVDYCLYNPDFVNDSGENVTFINCTFYRGVINAYRCSLNMYGCTIHLENQIEHSSYGQIGHLFMDGSYDFTDCHFEILNPSKAVRYCIYSVGGQVNIQGGEFLAGGCAYKEAIFATNGWYYFTPSVINIVNVAMQYFLTRMDTENGVIAKGNVTIRAKGHMYNTNYSNTIQTKVYDTTNDAFKINYSAFTNYPLPLYIIDKNYTNYYDNAIVKQDGNKIDISNINNAIGKGGIYKIVAVNGHRACHYRLKATPLSPSNLQLQVQFGAEIVSYYGIMFINSNGQIINFDYNDSYHNDSSYAQVNTTGQALEIAYTIPIPAKADFILYGIGYNVPSAATSVSFSVDYCSCELI